MSKKHVTTTKKQNSDNLSTSESNKKDDLDLSAIEETETDPIDSEQELDDEEEEPEQELDDEEDEITSELENKSVDKEICIYENAPNEKNSESEEDDGLIFDDEESQDEGEFVAPELRKTRNILYNYERVRLLGDRTKQLTLGAKPMIKNAQNLDAREIAELELVNSCIPLIIIRQLPSGKKEKWYVKELQH